MCTNQQQEAEQKQPPWGISNAKTTKEKKSKKVQINLAIIITNWDSFEGLSG